MSEFIQGLIKNSTSIDWNYVMGTLVIRFLGVFIVLAILMIGMMTLGKVVSRMLAQQPEKDGDPKDEDDDEIHLAEAPEIDAGEEETAAVIGAAIAFAIESERKAVAFSAQVGSGAAASAGTWLMTGRVTQMNRRLQGGSHKGS